jgi:hypothetical protein
MDFRQKLLGCSALLGVWLAVPAIASAQSMSDADKIQKLERQTDLFGRESANPYVLLLSRYAAKDSAAEHALGFGPMSRP